MQGTVSVLQTEYRSIADELDQHTYGFICIRRFMTYVCRSFSSSCAACACILCKDSSMQFAGQIASQQLVIVYKEKCTAGGASLVPAVITLKAVSPDAGVAILGTGVQLQACKRAPGDLSRAHADTEQQYARHSFLLEPEDAHKGKDCPTVRVVGVVSCLMPGALRRRPRAGPRAGPRA